MLKIRIIQMFIIPFLISDKDLNELSKDIFKKYLSLYEPGNEDWRYRKLISFCLYRSLTNLILTTLNSKELTIETNIDFKKLKSIIGMKSFKDYYFDNLSADWMQEKWYNNQKLPLIYSLRNKLVVLDGNHRLCQQFHHNEIKFNLVTLKGGWFNLFFRMIFRKL